MKKRENKKDNQPRPLKLTNCLILSARPCKNGHIIIVIEPYFRK